MNKKIKVGIDLHGVITDMPDFFAYLTKILIDSGSEVHIITGGVTDSDKKLLEDYNIKWTHFFSISDYHKNIGTPTDGYHQKYGFPMVSDEEWDRTKGEYCERNEISIHIDDTTAYNEYFKTPFCRLWSNNGKPKPKHKPKRHIE